MTGTQNLEFAKMLVKNMSNLDEKKYPAHFTYKTADEIIKYAHILEYVSAKMKPS